jgi:hypothetical protein
MIPTLFLALALPHAPTPAHDDRVDAWTEDVLHLVEEIERLHPDPFFGVPREEFEAAVDALLARLDDLDDAAIAAEVARLVALLSRAGREGHSGVFLHTGFAPVQLYGFADGWFVVDADEPQRELVGTRLVAVGGVPVDEACARLSPYLTRDNDWNLRMKLGPTLANLALLSAAGLSDGETVVLRIDVPAKGERDASLSPAPFQHGEVMRRSHGTLPRRRDELWLTGTDRAWRLEVLPEQRALYVQYNQVVPSGEGQTLADFAAGIVRTFEQQKLERVIVDVRSNGGGDNTTFGPLIKALQTPSIDREGVLYGLIGRATFSAAGNFVTVLQRDTKAILVGEPTGGAPNQYGDARTVALPHHGGLEVRIATRYHEFGGPEDVRLTHEPDLAVPLSSADYFAGRDPVLQAALTHRGAR